MFCNKCGHPVNPNDQFCVQCGEPLRNLRQRVENNSSRQVPPRVQPSAQRQVPPPHPSAQRQVPPPNNYGSDPRYVRPTPPPAPAKKKRSAFPFVIGGALAMCVVVCIVAIVFLLGGRNSHSKGTTVGTGEYGKADNAFEAYIVNYLIPQYSVYATERQWKAQFYNSTNSLNLYNSGLLSTQIADLDKDGDDELLVAQMSYGGSTYGNTITLSVYEKNKNTVYLADSMEWQPCTQGLVYDNDGYGDPIFIEDNPIAERTALISLIDQKDSMIIFNEYHLGGEVVQLDMPTQIYWSLAYEDEDLHYTSSFLKSDIGTDTADFIGFEFPEKGPSETNIIFNTNDDISTFSDKTVKYFEDHGIAIDGSKIDFSQTVQDDSVLVPSDNVSQVCKFHIKPSEDIGESYIVKMSLTDSSVLHQKIGNIIPAKAPYELVFCDGFANGTEILKTYMTSDLPNISTYEFRRGNQAREEYGMEPYFLTNGDIVYYYTLEPTTVSPEKTDETDETEEIEPYKGRLARIYRLDLSASGQPECIYEIGTQYGISFLGCTDDTIYLQPVHRYEQEWEIYNYEQYIISYNVSEKKETKIKQSIPRDHISIWQQYLACPSTDVRDMDPANDDFFYEPYEIYDNVTQKATVISEKCYSAYHFVYDGWFYYIDVQEHYDEAKDYDLKVNVVKQNMADPSDKVILAEIDHFVQAWRFTPDRIVYTTTDDGSWQTQYFDEPYVDLEVLHYETTGPDNTSIPDADNENSAKVEDNGTDADTTTEAPHASVINMDDIMSTYNKAMDDYYADTYRWGLVYVDNDDIPELILIDSRSSHGNKPQVYTYRDGQAVLCDNLGSHFGEFNYVPRQGLVAECLFGNGGYITTNIHKLENGNVSDVVLFYNTDEISRDGETYQVNEQQTTKEDYFNQVDEYIGSQNYKLLTYDELPASSGEASLNGDNYQNYIVEPVNNSIFADLYRNR